MTDALERGEFCLEYQPQYSVATRRLSGAECLLRWHCMKRTIPPVEFIPTLEANGMIVPVGHWLLENACRQVNEWKHADRNLRVSINVSARQFVDNDMTAVVLETLANTCCDPRSICLEITESILIDKTGTVARQIHELHKAGIAIALDDFGTGYSNLAALHNLPISEIKIDRSFVEHINDDNKSLALTRTIISMARDLGAETVAEGVETPMQLDTLLNTGVDYLQGYLLGRPMAGTLLTEHFPGATCLGHCAPAHQNVCTGGTAYVT